MTLDAFIAKTIQELEDFKKWWLAQQAQAPSDFPSTMTAGEWNEQFLSTLTTIKNKT